MAHTLLKPDLTRTRLEEYLALCIEIPFGR